MTSGLVRQAFVEHFAAGTPTRRIDRDLPVEVPVALEYDGITYAVMMATPVDLDDYARGFAIGEGLLTPETAPLSSHFAEVEHGWIVRTTLPGGTAQAMVARVRRRIGDSSCGLCGMETLAEVARSLPQVAVPCRPEPAAVFAALRALRTLQPLGRATGAMHAAAICAPDGRIAIVREDVGRHNALDKAIGALAAQQEQRPMFALLSARCSYELVEKAVRGGLGGLVTISAPTSMAIRRARDAGLALYVLARSDSILELA
ncbi:formate dehydrogenase accessory sulfurtransferase FdhD [Croceicoccus sp. F390]|uniref:Sulfur carrier protein FdhD n=1 Tax=Croceicoccus esteveae TaxID=3075597 RepID=A0ABU2ZJ06_9SPHN|nr:formate dehydrogenase accessory sulfurtransferase FdhD [Croceicoccus sp. F390]MDT0576579.1 formate dehydrogenase accessory sulfurtransferase FdhD [Croceicoccus sp. F390]